MLEPTSVLTSSPRHGALTLDEVLRVRARRDPNARACLFLPEGEHEGPQFTYAGLDRRARAIAARLRHDVAPGERALLLYPPGLEFLEAFLGCLYAGVIAVPAYPPEPGRMNRTLPRLQAILQDARPALILTPRQLHPSLGELRSPGLAWEGVRGLVTDEVDTERWRQWRPSGAAPDTTAFLQYTSGSTSSPKGVRVSHANLLHTLADMDVDFEHGPDSVMVTWLPTFHDLGLIYGLLLPLFMGFPCVLMSPASFLQRPARWLQALSHYRGTHTAAPDFAFRLCTEKLSARERETLDLSALKVVLNAAEPIRPQTMRRFIDTFAPCGFRPSAMCPGYGLAEFSLKVTTQPPDAPPLSVSLDAVALESHRLVEVDAASPGARQVVGCGRPGMDTRIEIVHPGSQKRCGPDEVGEIWVAGTSRTQGYWNRPEESAVTFQAFLADGGGGPFLRTGDLGFLRHGELFITGRLKDLVIIRGRNHYPQDLEHTAESSHPLVRSGCSAVFSQEVDGEETVTVVAELNTRELPHLEAEEIARVIREAITGHHQVSVHAVVLLKPRSIPKTSSGKIQRQACRMGVLRGALEVLAHVRFAAPRPVAAEPRPSRARAVKVTREELTDWLLARLSRRLGIDRRAVRLEESFSHHGLDSAGALDLAADLGDWLGRPLPANLLYAHPTLGALIAHLSEATEDPSPTGPMDSVH